MEYSWCCCRMRRHRNEGPLGESNASRARETSWTLLLHAERGSEHERAVFTTFSCSSRSRRSRQTSVDYGCSQEGRPHRTTPDIGPFWLAEPAYTEYNYSSLDRPPPSACPNFGTSAEIPCRVELRLLDQLHWLVAPALRKINIKVGHEDGDFEAHPESVLAL